MPVGRAMTTSMPVARAGLARDRLPFELGLLVDVAGLERRVFVGRRMLDVAVHADGAAVHDALRTPPTAAAMHDVANRGRVHRAVLVVAQPGLPVDGGDVVDDVDPGARALERRRVAKIAVDSSIPADVQAGARGRRRRRRPAPRPALPRRRQVRARWPPVNPVAPVTRTRNAPPRTRDRGAEQAVQSRRATARSRCAASPARELRRL